ncbi:uncharacterized protein LOC135809853 [Sycon ciliatum]|uniref:uncharacterized protein LOC135809853 n=1 Tax=Sycon ciliatum TaxID=27933 RepID=UPI0031F71E64
MADASSTLSLTGGHDGLLCCAILAVDSFERIGSPFLLSVLKREFGDRWRQQTVELLGEQARCHVPSNGRAAKGAGEPENFDLYQICTLMLKLNNRLTSKTSDDVCSESDLHRGGNRSGDGMPSLHSLTCTSPKGDKGLSNATCNGFRLSQFELEEIQDRRRALLNSIMMFRNKLFKNYRSLSSKETLSSLLAMVDLCDMFYGSGVDTTGRSTTAAGSWRDELEKITCAVDTVRDLCPHSGSDLQKVQERCPFQARTISVPKRVAVRLIGMRLLQSVAGAASPFLAKGLHSMEVHADSRFSFLTETETGERTADILSVHTSLVENIIQPVKSKQKMSPEQKRVFDALLDCHPQKNLKSNTQAARTFADQLESRLNQLCGKNGLRNQVCHTSCSQLPVTTLVKLLEKARQLIQILTGATSSPELSSVAKHVLMLKLSGTSEDIQINLSLEEEISNLAISEQHHLLQPRAKMLFGRSDLVNSVVSSLATQPGAVVLCGRAGVGKTAVAVEVAHALRQAYPQQHWISATSAASLCDGIARLGQHVKAASSAEGSLSQAAGIEFLRESQGLLLVIDDVRDPSLIASVLRLPHEVYRKHAFILTSLIQNTELWTSALRCIAVHKVPPLATEDSLRYLAQRCPTAAFTAFAANPASIHFIEDQLQNCPLALELTARLLRQKHDMLAVHRMFSGPSQDTATLLSIQTQDGESRFSRCLSTTVKMLLRHVSSKATILLHALALLAGETCDIPWWIFCQREEAVCAVSSLAGCGNFLFCSCTQASEERQLALQELEGVGLIEVSYTPEVTAMITVPLLVQKVLNDELGCNSISVGSPDCRLYGDEHLCSLLMTYVLRLLCVISEDDPARMLKTFSSLFPVVKGLVNHPAPPSTDVAESKVRLLIWLSRSSFALHHDWSSAISYLLSALESGSTSVNPGEECVLQLEYGALLWRVEEHSTSVDVLEKVLANIQEWDHLEVFVDPFDPSITYTKFYLQSMAHQELINASNGSPHWEKVAVSFVDSINSSKLYKDSDYSEAALSTKPGFGMLACQNSVVPQSEQLLPAGFTDGCRVWLSGDTTGGLDAMLASVIEAYGAAVDGDGRLPVRAVLPLYFVGELCMACKEDEAMEFFTAVCITLVFSCVPSVAPKPNGFTALKKAFSRPDVTQAITQTFKQNFMGKLEALFRRLISRCFSSFEFIGMLPLQNSLEDVLVQCIQFMSRMAQGTMCSVANLCLGALQYHLDPAECQTFRAEMVSRRLEKAMRQRSLTVQSARGADNIAVQFVLTFLENSSEHALNTREGYIEDSYSVVEYDVDGFFKEAGEWLEHAPSNKGSGHPVQQTHGNTEKHGSCAHAQQAKANGEKPMAAANALHALRTDDVQQGRPMLGECNTTSCCAAAADTKCNLPGDHVQGLVDTVQTELASLGVEVSHPVLYQLALTSAVSEKEQLLNATLDMLHYQ